MSVSHQEVADSSGIAHVAQEILSEGVAVSTLPLHLLYSYYLNAGQLKMFGGKSYDPVKDIPNLSGKVIFVTGGNTGLGKETILQLAAHKPAHIYLAARTASKADEAIADIKKAVPEAPITHLNLDLASFASIKECVQEFTEKSSRLDLLINNAGIMMTPMGLTKEGYELQFGTNHMGHFLLTKLLLPTLLKTTKEPNSDVRIVNVSSLGQNLAPSGILPTEASQLEKYTTQRRYGFSKLCNILFTKALASRYPEIKSVATHPGVILTNLYLPVQTNAFMRFGVWLMGTAGSLVLPNVSQGAWNQLWAATSPRDGLENGAFYVPVGKKNTWSRVSWDDALVYQLWEYSEKEVTKHERVGRQA